jgi:hypothetical protein
MSIVQPLFDWDGSRTRDMVHPHDDPLFQTLCMLRLARLPTALRLPFRSPSNRNPRILPLLIFQSPMTIAAAADWIRVTPARDSTPPFSVFSKTLQKSEQDDRDYRIIELENGLQATLVHDPKADKAAASLDVAVGHLYDPVSNETWSVSHRELNGTRRMICQVSLTFASICYLW